MKAQRVSGLEGELPLSEAARRIVAVRTAELYAFVPEALGEHAVSAMHDMRIAAKRLRYLLELVGFCFGDVGEEARARARELQEVLGEIHDCDVMLERIAASAESEPEGFRMLASRFAARRGSEFARFLELWAQTEASGLRDRLLVTTFSSPAAETVGA
ncbi:MAG TPA: CHAD domain-containing protein [Solirubrobacteraceae bacterium]|nr:CHAD domain-containing protein [Solirubrobacteraceae bacterium]